MSEPAETFIEFQKTQKHRISKQRKYCSIKQQSKFSEMFKSVKKAFPSFKKHRETCDMGWGYSIYHPSIQLSLTFFSPTVMKRGLILLQISIKLHTIAESSLHCDLVVAPRMRSFGQSSRNEAVCVLLFLQF